jgi:hypothetical protein
MAALGNCSGVNSSTFVNINEITTVAAAYALSGFMTTSTSGSLFQANVSAPAANRGATGTSAVAAGLAHAFLNAASLANYASGTANTQTTNITVGSATVNGIVPTVEINTLGDILQSCVNGTTGNAQCIALFADTPSISGAAPTNTLQSMIYLARNPASATAMNTSTGLYSLVNSTPAFNPQLTGAPPDWSLAIVYISAAAFPAQYDIALDANDTVYTGRSATAVNIAALNVYGGATPAFTAGGTGTATRQIAPDAIGNVWVTNNGTTLYQYSATSGGAPTNSYILTGGDLFGVAVDKSNNVWVANAVATSPNVTEYKYSSGSYAASYTATAAGGFEPVELTIDAAQNIWVSAYYTGGNLADVIANQTPASTPSYSVSGTPISATFAGSATKPLGVVIDASGNAWYGITGSNTVTTTGIEEVVPSVNGSSVITSLTPAPLVANATLGAAASQIPGIDGAGSVYLPDNQGSGALGIHVYSTVAVPGNTSQVLSPPAGYLGCYLATATTTTCGTGAASAVYNPREIQIDSTGSVWAGITLGGFTQLVGLGSPSWPLLQTGKPGVSPGNTTATPLP